MTTERRPPVEPKAQDHHGLPMYSNFTVQCNQWATNQGFKGPQEMTVNSNMSQNLGQSVGMILRDVIPGSDNFPGGVGKPKGPAGGKHWLKGPTMGVYMKDPEPCRKVTSGRKWEETEDSEICTINPPHERRDVKNPKIHNVDKQDSGKRSQHPNKRRWQDCEK